MVSTHMGYGFVFAYVLTLILDRVLPGTTSSDILSSSVVLVLFGLMGGVLPDVDALEPRFGFKHRNTLHFLLGYGFLAVVLGVISYFYGLVIFTKPLICFLSGAWLHSVMDIFDGFWAEDPNKGVFEHISRKWIRAMDWVPFASLWEWSLQSLCGVFALGISPQLPMLCGISGWVPSMASYFAVWSFSTFYEFTRRVPKRQEMERRTRIKYGLKPK